MPSSGQLGYNNYVSGIVSPTSGGGSANLTVTTSSQISALVAITLPSVGIYIISCNTNIITPTALTNFYYNTYLSNSGYTGTISTSNFANYVTSVPTSIQLSSINSGVIYPATSSTLTVTCYFTRHLISGTGSGTTLDITVYIQYVRVG